MHIYVYMYHLLIYVLYINWCRLNSVNMEEPYGKILQLTCPYCHSGEIEGYPPTMVVHHPLVQPHVLGGWQLRGQP